MVPIVDADYVVSGLAVVYTLRVNMSVAAQKMRDELNWSESDKGYVLVMYKITFVNLILAF